MPRTAAKRYVQGREPATGNLNGEPFVIGPRTILVEDDPLVRAYPHLFKPLEPSRQRPTVEQTTAAPGEKRGDR